MLLRSSSTPILNSWLPHSKDSSTTSPQSEVSLPIPKSKPVSPISFNGERSASFKMTRAVSDSDLRDLSVVPKRKLFSNKTGVSENGFSVEEEEEREAGSESMSESLDRVLQLGSGLDGGGGGGCWIGGGGDGGAGGGSGGEGYEEDGGDNKKRGSGTSTDVYYEKMIEANPGNPLVLGNYARYLKEVLIDTKLI